MDYNRQIQKPSDEYIELLKNRRILESGSNGEEKDQDGRAHR